MTESSSPDLLPPIDYWRDQHAVEGEFEIERNSGTMIDTIRRIIESEFSTRAPSSPSFRIVESDLVPENTVYFVSETEPASVLSMDLNFRDRVDFVPGNEEVSKEHESQEIRQLKLFHRDKKLRHD